MPITTSQNRRSPTLNPQPRVLEPETPNDLFHRGYVVLDKAERGRPREGMADRLRRDFYPPFFPDY